MQVAGKTAIVTGGGNGIGAAIAAALADGGARVVVADMDTEAAQRVTAAINAEHPRAAVHQGGDAADPADIAALIELADLQFGSVDMYFANAGIAGPVGFEDLTGADWDRVIDVNLRAHIRAATQLVPRWTEGAGGYFVSTASAAGLLTQIGSAGYSVTKHAAVGFAEWLSVTYGDRGVKVSCLCPMGVDTKLLSAGFDADDRLGRTAARAVTTAGEVLTPERVAEVVLEAVADERFLILPHPQVLEMYQHKGSDYDRWLSGMRRYQASLLAADSSD